MPRYILGLHGLKNKPPAPLLKKWWHLAMLEGLDRIGSPRIKVPFDLIYWADELYPEPLNPSIKDPEDDLYLYERYEWGASAILDEKAKSKGKIRRYIEKRLHQIFLNPDLSLNYEKITDSVVEYLFNDLDKYFSNDPDENDMQPTTRERVMQKMLDVLDQHPKDKIMLIAHSMGSIIAYDVLTQYPEKCGQIDLLVTIGSPLGLPIILGKLAHNLPGAERSAGRLRTPSVLKGKWLNLADPEDKIAFDQLLADDYDANESGVKVEDVSVFNDYLNQEERNPHKSFGYLRSSELSEAVNEFLDQPSGIMQHMMGKVVSKILLPFKRILHLSKKFK